MYISFAYKCTSKCAIWAQTGTTTTTPPVPIIEPTPVSTTTSSNTISIPSEVSTGTVVSPVISIPQKSGTLVMRTFVIGKLPTIATATTGVKAIRAKTDTKIHVDEMIADEVRSNFSFVLDETKRSLLEQFVFSLSSINDNAMYQTNVAFQKLEILLMTAKTLVEKKTLTIPDSASSFQSVLQDAEATIAYGKTIEEKQKTKLYELSVSQDDFLTTDIKDTRDTFKKDMKKLQDAVVNAKVAVRAVFELLRTVQ